jgi:hypothetical protein
MDLDTHMTNDEEPPRKLTPTERSALWVKNNPERRKEIKKKWDDKFSKSGGYKKWWANLTPEEKQKIRDYHDKKHNRVTVPRLVPREKLTPEERFERAIQKFLGEVNDKQNPI